MSFLRLIYYSAMVGGWAGFLGWFLGEALLMHHGAQVEVSAIVVTTALCGAFIAAGLALLAGMARGTLARGLLLSVGGFGGGLVAGAVGSMFGNLIYSVLHFPILPRALGFMVMGLAIGSVDGLFVLNWRRFRNGLLGGALGGFLGGLLFDPLLWIVRSPMSSRAIALATLGFFIGLFIGFAQVLLREAWLTVVQGFRPGRQLVLTEKQTTLGTSERANLIFIAYGASGVEPTHACVEKQQDGNFWIKDNGTRTGTFVNDQLVARPCALHNGDVIRIGINAVRFNERFRPVSVPAAPPAVAIPVAVVKVASPSPSPKSERPSGSASKSSIPPQGPKPVVIPAATPAPRPERPRAPAAKPALPQKKADRECPVCGTKASRTKGKVVCENCGVVF
jgi:FHA domain